MMFPSDVTKKVADSACGSAFETGLGYASEASLKQCGLHYLTNRVNSILKPITTCHRNVVPPYGTIEDTFPFFQCIPIMFSRATCVQVPSKQFRR